MHNCLVYVFAALSVLSVVGASPSAGAEEGNKYAVVVSEKTLADENWARVVETLEKKYDGKTFVYKHPGISTVREKLSKYMPHYVCIVAKSEEATSELIQQARKTLLWLDDDPYEDALWAILTGYTVEDAMRIATAEPLTVTRGLSHVGSGWLDWLEEGLAFSESEKNAKFVKKPGKKSKKVKGPDDTTKEIVNALNSNKYHIMSSSGHATQRDWMMGFNYKNGKIVSKDGRLFAISSTGKKYEIKTTNPKIYYSPGNCLIAHISHKGCMALAWIHSGVNQFFGHIVLQGRICTAWSIISYFFGLQDRFTYAEAVYISRQTAQSFITGNMIDGRTQALYSRCLNGTLLYGDPAWAARVKKTAVAYYDQELEVEKREDGKYRITFRIKANRDISFSNRSHGGAFAFLPVRVKNAEVESTTAHKVLVADNFILMWMGAKGAGKLKKGDERSAVVIAEPLAGWAYLPDDKLPLARKDLLAMYQEAIRLLQGKNYRAAIAAYKSILRRFPEDPNALYNTACAYSLLSEKKEAVEFLKKAFKAGFTDLDHIKTDPDLKNIREEEGYKKLIGESEDGETVDFDGKFIDKLKTRVFKKKERNAHYLPLEVVVKRKKFMLLIFCCLTSLAAAGEDEGWLPISMKVNDVSGVCRWSVNWDISFHYSRFDKTLPDGDGVFTNRQIDKGAFLPGKPLVTRSRPGIDESPGGANVSMASMPPSKRLPGRGGELFRNNDGKTAHQRDWDALVAVREQIFKKHNVTQSTALREKVKWIADWAREVNRNGPIYESKHPVDLIFHPSFCAGRANAFVAIMHTMGIPARTINMNTHTVAEVLLNGRWTYVENIKGTKKDTRKTASLMPCSLMEFYTNPHAYREHTSESHIVSDYFRSKDLHNGRANWQLGALWKWHFIQCGKGDDMMMRNTMENGSGIAMTLNSATSAALYPNSQNHYYKVLKGNPPVMTNYQKHSWYRAGFRVLQGDRIRKRFYIGNLSDPDNPVTKVTSRLHLMGGGHPNLLDTAGIHKGLRGVDIEGQRQSLQA